MRDLTVGIVNSGKMASWPAFSLQERNFARDGKGKICKWVAVGDPYASEDEEEIVFLETSVQGDAVLLSKESIWKSLPEEILDIILARLPFAARCRFQCVCRRWKEFLSFLPPPSCTIMSTLRDRKARFYCESEKKWFSLPSNRLAPLGRTWEIVDAEAGLICYQSTNDEYNWLWVCNPLKPTSSRLIAPDYPRREVQVLRRPRQPPKLKLLVDRANGTFKIVAILDQMPMTAVYESATSQWQLFPRSTLIVSFELFLWKNVVHAHSTGKKWIDTRLVNAFNVESGQWIRDSAEIPSEFQFPTNRFFLSDNDQVILVLYSYRKRPRPYFSVWKLLDEGLSPRRPGSFAMRENWEKVPIASGKGTFDLAGYILACASYATGHICFSFRDGNIKGNGFKAPKILRYSFAAKSWSVLSYPERWGESIAILNWEPSLDIDPS